MTGKRPTMTLSLLIVSALGVPACEERSPEARPPDRGRQSPQPTVGTRPIPRSGQAAKRQDSSTRREVKMTPRQPSRLRIEYGYKGEFGIYGIADTASGFDGSTLVAKAKAVQIVKKDPGPNHILIEEEHYDEHGEVTYTGTLEIRFGFGGGTLVAESPISGQKRYNVFGGWPSGN